jgi:hypothetical protein
VPCSRVALREFGYFPYYRHDSPKGRPPSPAGHSARIVITPFPVRGARFDACTPFFVTFRPIAEITAPRPQPPPLACLPSPLFSATNRHAQLAPPNLSAKMPPKPITRSATKPGRSKRD